MSEQQVLTIIKSSPVTSYKLDPIPARVFKQCVEELHVLPVMTAIINGSVRSGCMPTPMKQALVIHHLKNPTLDAENLANYRPISNLKCLVKLIEMVAVTQLCTSVSSRE